jgi:hypothetical protein
VDAAEDDVLGLRLRRHHRQLIGISRQVGVADNVVALVVVAEDDDAAAKFAACGLDPRRHLFVRHDQIIFDRSCFF